MNKHTPGPWEVAYLDRNGQSVVKAEHIEVATCWHHCVMSIEEEMHSNAHLIAAAPELLEALREVKGMMYAQGMLNTPVGAQVCAAIAKATGA